MSLHLLHGIMSFTHDDSYLSNKYFIVTPLLPSPPQPALLQKSFPSSDHTPPRVRRPFHNSAPTAKDFLRYHAGKTRCVASIITNTPVAIHPAAQSPTRANHAGIFSTAKTPRKPANVHYSQSIPRGKTSVGAVLSRRHQE